MCDTLAVKRGGSVWFAKNSDREPDEPQITEYIAPVSGDPATRLRCTYIEVEQVPDRRGAVISRPAWMWGAEIGVNDAGVAIGNEAVFSKGILRKGEALLGMDLLRLALERAATAREAANLIIGLLERYGQGGGAGFSDKNFRYDNSFLIADASSIHVLETAGRSWALKYCVDGWTISNSYTLRDDWDRSSEVEGVDFKAKHETALMPMLACAAERRLSTLGDVRAAPEEMSLTRLAAYLRRHSKGDGFSAGANRDVCMHASGLLRPHATTASMIMRLSPGAPPAIAATGTIHPCISLFKPAGFSENSFSVTDRGLFKKGLAAAIRARKDPNWREELRASIAHAETDIFPLIEANGIEAADASAREWAAAWLD